MEIKTKLIKFEEAYKCQDSDEFRKLYILYYKQKIALKQGFTYFEKFPEETFGDLMFDNDLRLHFLKHNNKKFKRMHDLSKLQNLAYQKFKEDIQKSRSDSRGS